jgi:hypothetical protein
MVKGLIQKVVSNPSFIVFALWKTNYLKSKKDKLILTNVFGSFGFRFTENECWIVEMTVSILRANSLNTN